MYARTHAAEAGGGSSGTTDVSTELTALRADITGLADFVKRLAAEAPDLAKEGFELRFAGTPCRLP